MPAPASIAHRHHDPVRTARPLLAEDPGVCGGELRIAGRPAAVAAAIHSADPATQGRLIGQLQRQVGNETVGQLLALGRAPGTAQAGLSVQRWPVSVAAGTSDCAVVVNWISAHSPYRQSSGWAQTRPTFGWGGDFAYSGSGDSLTVSISNPSVSLATAVDMPSWAPTNPSMSRAWTAMWADLRAHESLHEGVANTWKDTLLSRLTSLSLPIARQADGPAAVRRAWAGWIAEHQAEQTALDPFTAILDCSGGSDESTANTGETSGTSVAAADPGADDPSTA